MPETMTKHLADMTFGEAQALAPDLKFAEFVVFQSLAQKARDARASLPGVPRIENDHAVFGPALDVFTSEQLIAELWKRGDVKPSLPDAPAVGGAVTVIEKAVALVDVIDPPKTDNYIDYRRASDALIEAVRVYRETDTVRVRARDGEGQG